MYTHTHAHTRPGTRPHTNATQDLKSLLTLPAKKKLKAFVRLSEEVSYIHDSICPYSWRMLHAHMSHTRVRVLACGSAYVNV